MYLFLLALILVVGAALRVFAVDWDSGTMPHPDERSTVAFYAPSMRWPADMSLKQALDPRQSRLNPFWDVDGQHRRSYTYGHFPLYTLVLTAEAAHGLLPIAEQAGAPDWATGFLSEARTPSGYAYLGRMLVALADTMSILLLFLLGRRLYCEWAGLLAAAFASVTVLQIQLSHFFAVDPVSTTFTLLAIYGAVRMTDGRRTGAALVTGIGIGLAVASKFSALPIIAAPIVAMVVDVSRAEAADRSRLRNEWLVNLLIAGGTSLIVFAVTSPFVFLDFRNFWQAVVVEQGNMVRGVADFPFTRQYRGTIPYLYYLQQQVQWGMGIPLGIISLIGTAWVGWRAIRGKASLGEWVIISWLLLYFVPTGLFLAKFMRYMAPVVPLLSLFGAGLAFWGRARRVLGRFEPVRVAVIILALLGTVVWALAFVAGVYGTEHSWVTASRWVYSNVPDGSCIAVEHWEEGFPRTWPEAGMNPAAHGYQQPLLPMYEEDSRQKFETIRDTLKSCDYIVLASNRMWRTIPRLVTRYPMSTAYYAYLFDGQLGYEQVYSYASPPRLGPLVIDDQDADESFTVYDHPKAIVFRKERQLSDAEWETLLGDKWQDAVPGYVGSPTLLARLIGGKSLTTSKTPIPQKPLTLATPVDRLPVVDDYHWNTPANRWALVAVAVWWLAVQIVGWLSWPLTRRVFSRLPDQGYLLSKSLGWLLVGFGVWFCASWRLLPNRLPTILGFVLLLAGGAAWLFGRDRHELIAFWRRQKRVIFIGEGLFTLSFVFFVGLRLLNPDLWQPWNGGEKMLEIGFLHAIVKSAAMPPYDPFFAGGYINYYYYGLFLVGILVKLTGIQPTIAFNLAVPTLAALTVANVSSLAFNLTLPPAATIGGRTAALSDTWRAVVASLLAVLLVVFIGNLAGFEQLVHMLEAHGGSDFQTSVPVVGEIVRASSGLRLVVMEGIKLPPYNYWDPTRAIPDTINEFPYFSFIFADLHPHMIGLPFTVLLLSLALTWLKSGSKSSPMPSVVSAEAARGPVVGFWRKLVLDLADMVAGVSWGELLRWLVLPLCLGALAVINTWDLPTYLGIATAAFWLQRYRRHMRPELASPIDGVVGEIAPRGVMSSIAVASLEALVFGGVTLVFSYLLYLPFFSHYQPLDVGLGLVRDKTDLGRFVAIWGVFLFVAVSYAVVSLIYPNSRLSGLRFASLYLRRWNAAPRIASLQRSLGVGMEGSAWLVILASVGAVGVSAVLWALGYRVPAVLLPCVVVALLLLLRPDQSEEESYIGLLLVGGLLVLLGVEILFLRDFLGGSSYYRMNTLFKFYIQVWVMLGVAAACIVVFLWRRALHWRRWGLATVWQCALVLLLAASLVYPILGTRTRIHDRFDKSPGLGTLDGMAYMKAGALIWPQDNRMELAYDYDAIRWLQQHVKGTPILAEAKIGYYREGGMRVAAYTGLPTPLGGLHQSEQRPGTEIAPRDIAYMEFWNTPDPEHAWQLIADLGISYIYLGQLEKTLYDPAQTDVLRQWGVTTFSPQGRQKFDTLLRDGRLTPIYHNERTEILAVVK